ncbi:unnamed protein product [Brugia pahangi]|uniref:C2H2-type domain-containing protein n=1 Tax=Brugia pahangi TaxID=6280 RepID=A0A0N4SXP7_BRUPA|nr:unnamed protein product [Brugia pahangi]
MEEHTRSHLTQPSYRCSVGHCTLKHHSKNFLTRHMKEVHKYKQTPTDIIELDPSLKKEFCRVPFYSILTRNAEANTPDKTDSFYFPYAYTLKTSRKNQYNHEQRYIKYISVKDSSHDHVFLKCIFQYYIDLLQIASRCFPNHFSDHFSSFHIFRRSVSQSPLLESLTETNWCIPSTCSVPSVMQNTALSMSTLTSTFETFSSPSPKPTSSLLTAILPLNLTLQTSAPSSDVALLLPTAPIPSRDTPHFNDPMGMSNFPVTNLECQPFVFHEEEHSSSNCITLTNLLAAAPKNSPSQTRVQSIIYPPTPRKTCSFCQEVFEGEYLVLYKHVKQHLSLLPYECSVCKFAHVDRVTIQDHISHYHLQATLVDRMTDSVSRQCSALFTACFPDVPLQPLLHDTVQK